MATTQPVFPPVPIVYEDQEGTDFEQMSLRAYAAIQLRVPDSGIAWLDKMIRQARKLDHAQSVRTHRAAEE
jgi:hypothetical protein